MFNKLIKILSVEKVDTGEQQDRIQVAVAVLLLEMAHADKNFEPLEEKLIRQQLAGRFSLGADATQELLAVAEQVRAESVDVQQFTRLINSNFSIEDKLEVMECLWRIVYSDGQLDQYEDALARQISGLLYLPHKEAIARKIKVLKEVSPDR